MSDSKSFCNRLNKINWTNLDCFERRLSSFFRIYGSFVGRHPLPFILFPILIAGALAVGFLSQDEVTDATFLYTPVGARSKYERECVNEKWPMIDGSYTPGRGVTELRQALTTVTTTDGGSILRPTYADAVNRLNLFILYQIQVTYRNKTYEYMDLCLHWKDTCYTNPQVGLVSTLFNYPNPAYANLTYPSATIGDTSIYLASSLGGVEVNEKTNEINFAEAWLLLYQLRFDGDNVSYVSGLWELEFERRLLAYSDPLIQAAVFHSQTLSLELKRNGDQLAPRFAVSFGILVLFATAVTYSFVGGQSFPFIDWTVSKPLLAFLGAASGGMGIASAIGFLSFCGFLYNQIVGVMPFLVLAVALDGTFLLVSAYRHTSRSLDAGERVSQAMAKSASAVTVTMSASFFSFLTGFTVDIPAVQVFSVYTAVAIAMTFFYLMTFWLGFLVLAARNEEKARNAMFSCMKTVSPKEARTKSVFIRLFNQGTRSSSSPTALPSSANPTAKTDSDFVAKWFRETYAPILMLPLVRVLVLLSICAYIGAFGWLCTQVHQGLDPVKLLVKGSYATPYYRTMERYFWQNGSEMQLVVNNAPNLADLGQRRLVKDMAATFANTTHSMGLASVQFWLYDFEDYVEQFGLTQYTRGTMSADDFYQAVQRFLSLSANERLWQDVVWGYVKLPNTGTTWMIKSFRLVIGLTAVETAVKQIETVNLMRQLASDPRFAQMNITTFNPVWLIVDQYLGILPNIIHEVVAGMCFIVVIALLLIPHPLVSFWVAVTILSVDIGVMGFMTLWDISLDTISMITIMMSIGFSVDYAAYIAHAFVLSADKKASTEEKVKSAMGEIAWPILQGATSTVLGVVVLADLDSYMVVAFFKTVFLVIVLALLHGLVFLPVLLSVFVCGGCGKKAKKVERSRHVPKHEASPISFDRVITMAGFAIGHMASIAAALSYPRPPLAIDQSDHVSAVSGTPGMNQGLVPYTIVDGGSETGSDGRRGVIIMACDTPRAPRVVQRRVDHSAVE